MDYLQKRLLIDVIGFLVTSSGAIGLAYLIRKTLNWGSIVGIIVVALILFVFDFFNYKKRNNL